MLSAYFQIAIPLLVTAVFLLVIIFVRRYFRAGALLTCVVVLALGVITAAAGVRSGGVLFGHQFRADAAAPQRYDQTQTTLLVAEQYILSGCYDEARELLDALQYDGGENAEAVLASARLSMLLQDPDRALQLYEKAGRLAPDAVSEEELSLCRSMTQASTGDDAVIAYLSNSGYAPEDYGLQPGTVYDEQSAMEQITQLLEEDLQQRADSAELGGDGERAAYYAAALTSAFSHYLSQGLIDTETVESDLRKLDNAMQQSEALCQNSALRIARLKGWVLTEDYREIAGSIDSYASAEELMIVSELYLNGKVREADFSEDYVLDREIYETVIAQCEAAFDLLGDEERSVRREYEEKLDSIRLLERRPALANVRQSLLETTEGSDDALTSKSYLQLAKIENELGNSTQAETYVMDAFNTVSGSDDASYTVPMNSLLSVIEGTNEDGTEELKQVASYVEQAVDNSLPLNVSAGQLAATAVEDGGESQPEEGQEDELGFTDYMTSVVSEKTAVINIGAINKDNFPEVRARVQINSSQASGIQELQKALKVMDCGSQITEFTLEELEFQTSRIILLCDVSGSMSGNVASLQNAIIRFSEEMNADEQISVIGFDDGIVFEEPFTDDAATIASYADKIGAYGGTDMFSSLLYAGSLFPDDINANNIIILLTDGQDNNPAGDASIHNEITAMAADRNVTVYTLGLGSEVDTEYLTKLANAGNGSFLYVESEATLESFYDFIHQQLTNQYILSYTAKNTTLNTRKLELSVEGEVGGASKIYYLEEPEYSDQSSETYNPYVVVDGELSVYGLSTKFLYRSSSAQTVNLKGSGFDAGDDLTVRLVGTVAYTLQASFVDANTYQLTIPASIATGSYTLEVAARGETFTLKDELMVAVQGTEKRYRFGAYSFTSLESSTDEQGNTVLSGRVTMNGWLYFRGDVVIDQHELEAGKIRVTDLAGSYISFDAANSTGLAKLMADSGLAFTVSPLGSFYLHVDPYTAGEYEDFPVEPIDLAGEYNLAFFMLKNPTIAVYPDMLALNGFGLNLQLPFQKQLLRAFPSLPENAGSLDTSMLVTQTRTALCADLSYSFLGEDENQKKFFLCSLPLGLNELKISLDTLRNDYEFEGEVSFPALKQMDSLSLAVAWKEGRFDKVALGVGGDYKVTVMTTPIPVTMGNFGFELSGFSQYESTNDTLSNILSTTIAFNFEAGVADASAYLPAIVELLDGDADTALMNLKDAKVSATLKTFSFAFEADADLLGLLDIGHIEIEAGSFNYTNALVGLYDVTEYGLRAAVTLGSTWETSNLSLTLTGTTELTLGVPYTGLWIDGDCDFEVGWWLLRADVDVSGDILLGLYQNSAGNLQFSIIVRGENSKGEYSGFHLYITESTGLELKGY